jgi:indole-3-glycerol phosphate synthase
MQMRPRPFLNRVPLGDRVTLIGQLTRTATYDPVSTALRYVREGADAVSLFTDHTIYASDLDDMLLITRGIKDVPLLYQNYVLDEYHVAEVRAEDASADVLYASVLDSAMLRRTVTATQLNRMTAILQIEDESHLEQARELSPHAIGIGRTETEDCREAMALLERLRPGIPYNMRVMLMCCLRTLDAVAAAVDLGVDAVIVGENLLNQQNGENLRRLLSHDI